MSNSINELIAQRTSELLIPIDVQIMQCDKDSALMLACGMLQRATDILDAQLGEAGRKQIIRELM